MNLTVKDLKPAQYNPRSVTPETLAALKCSLGRFGDLGGITWNRRSGNLVGGHQRIRSLIEEFGEKLRIDDVDDERAWIVTPTGERHALRIVDWDEQTEKAANIAANNPHLQGDWDDAKLEVMLDELKEWDDSIFKDLRFDDLLSPDIIENGKGTLIERFGVPPFTILDARQGYWQERKAAWLAKGIESDAGRDGDLLWSDSARPPVFYALRNAMRERDGSDPTWEQVLAEAKRRGITVSSRTSIFDPVLCELAYRWFCPPGGRVLDPFAGGSVRGVVASMLGREYLGIDLRHEQVSANEAQRAKLFPEGCGPQWICGDSRTAAVDGEFDLVFSCPPYGDLEVYSDDPRDLSTMDYGAFLSAMRDVFSRCMPRLKPDRFMVWILGNFRDTNGNLHDFVGECRRMVEELDTSIRLYNDAILVTPAASLPIRAGRSFETTRKLGRHHQTVLVFVKGDARRATKAIGQVEFGEPEQADTNG